MSSASEDTKKEPISLRVPLVLLIVMGAFLIPAWIVYSRVHENERINASSHKNEISFAECISPDFSNFSTCFQQSVRSKHDQTKEYYDLKAQQDMAKWALLMFIVTGVGVGYLALTLHTTIATLDEARRATAAADRTVDETRKIGEAQTRVYITANSPSFQRASNGLVFEQHLNISGATPATDVSCYVELIGEKFPDRRITLHRMNYPVLNASDSEFKIREHNPTHTHELGIGAKVKTVIWYTDVFNVRFRTRITFALTINPRSGDVTVGRQIGSYGECFVEVARDGKEHDEDFYGEK